MKLTQGDKIQGSGSSTPNALAIAGYTTTNVANTESWNGTSWTELADLGTARREPSPGVYSANTASIIFAGYGQIIVMQQKNGLQLQLQPFKK